MSMVDFLRSPTQYVKARRKAKAIMRLAVRRMVASGVLRRIQIMSRIG